MNKKISFPKPNIIVSSCLGFEKVRYNDQMLHDEWIDILDKHVHFIKVCPEVAIGMGVPRFPIRIVSQDGNDELIQPATEENYTQRMDSFSNKFLNDLNAIDGFILKSRSPSCGLKEVKIYSSSGHTLGKRAGFFGQMVMDKYGDLAIEDEGRIKNLKIREHFLTKIYALARLREISEKPSAKGLIDFHSMYKYLLMSYGQQGLKKLGQIVANQKELGIENAIEKYVLAFRSCLKNPPKRSNVINTMTHMFGYFKKVLSPKEKQFYLETIDLYNEKRIPLLSVTTLLWSWVIRYEIEYLDLQSIFNPYPKALAILEDSGKQIDI